MRGDGGGLATLELDTSNSRSDGHAVGSPPLPRQQALLRALIRASRNARTALPDNPPRRATGQACRLEVSWRGDADTVPADETDGSWILKNTSPILLTSSGSLSALPFFFFFQKKTFILNLNFLLLQQCLIRMKL